MINPQSHPQHQGKRTSFWKFLAKYLLHILYTVLSKYLSNESIGHLQGYLSRFGDGWVNRYLGIYLGINSRRVKNFCPKLPFKCLEVAMIILEKVINGMILMPINLQENSLEVSVQNFCRHRRLENVLPNVNMMSPNYN